MNTRALRRIASRYGAAGTLFVGAILLIVHLWANRRRRLFAALTILSVCLGVGGLVVDRTLLNCTVSSAGITLYLGRNSEHIPLRQQPSDAVDGFLLSHWDEDAITPAVRTQVKQFASAIQLQDRTEAMRLGDGLFSLFRPDHRGPANADGVWQYRAAEGQIFLEQAWLDQADRDFRMVLAHVPSVDAEGGHSAARETADYGLARSCSLRGSYSAALEWLARAPAENRSGCGNAQELRADRDGPMNLLCAVARRSFPVAEAAMKQIMRGGYECRPETINGDTSQEQREHAAAEAALALGCLYAEHDRRAEAETCWQLLTADTNPEHESVVLARSLLRQGAGDALKHRSLDSQVIETVLQDLLTDTGPNAFIERNETLVFAPDALIYPVDAQYMVHRSKCDAETASKFGFDQRHAVSDAARDMTLRMAAHDGFRGFRSASERVKGPRVKSVLRGTKDEKVWQSVLERLSERQVRANPPGYSADKRYALVCMSVPWSVHSADATYLLVRRGAHWTILMRHFTYFC